MSTEPLALLALLQGALPTFRTPSYMHPSGAPADSEATLGWWLTIIACLVVIAVTITLLLAVWRHRHESDEPHAAERRKPVAAVSWIYVGVAITVVILLGTF